MATKYYSCIPNTIVQQHPPGTPNSSAIPEHALNTNYNIDCMGKNACYW